MAVKAIDPGHSTSVQDLGRPGHLERGIPAGGAMDGYALAAANLLVGNPEGAAGLEIAFAGPELLILRDVDVAVCGADLCPVLDGARKGTWVNFHAKKGQTLVFEPLKAGARAFVAFRGGIDVPLRLCSRSTFPAGGLGGLDGRPLAAGDVIPVADVDSWVEEGREIPLELRRLPGETAVVRAIPGLFDHRVSEEAAAAFWRTERAVSPDAGRVAVPLAGGERVAFVEGEPPFGAGPGAAGIVPCHCPPGAIRLPGEGEPAILHRDAVLPGDQVMIGTVISADMDLAGQLAPGTRVRFEPVDMEAALSARAEASARLHRLRTLLA